MTNVLEQDIECNGTTITVSTVREGSETLAALAARHDERVAAARAACTGETPAGLARSTEWKSSGEVHRYESDAGYSEDLHADDVATLQTIYVPD